MKKKSPPSNSRKPAMHGKRYAIAECPYCKASIYQRHLNIHIQQFHLDEIDGLAVLKKRDQKPTQEIASPVMKPITLEHSQPGELTKAREIDDSNPVAIKNGHQPDQVMMILDSNLMLLALTQGGMPCTSNELKARFLSFLEEQLKDTDMNTILIHIDW
jgi:hypothetical protein